MAFVFRSEKQPIFSCKKESPDSFSPPSLNNDQSQLNGTSYNSSPQNQSLNSPSKIVKGLPSLLKRDKSIKSGQIQSEKENHMFQMPKPEKIKVNLQKLNKVNETYVFSSNVARDINGILSKSLNKSQTCSDFNTSTSEKTFLLDQQKPFKTNYMTSNFVVNRNLVEAETIKLADFRKTQTEAQKRNSQLERILINCSKQNDYEMKRKSSPPPASEKSSHNSILRKLKSFKNKQQKSPMNQAQISMKTSLENKDSLLKKSQTQKKLMKLHKGNLQSSFYKQSESESSEQETENQNQTPGPGSYDNTINLRQKKSFRSRKQKFAKIFVSPLERFKVEEVKFQEITYVNQGQPQRVHQNQVFVSKTPKFMSFEKKSTSPQPGSYNPRSSLEHEIVRNLLRNANVASFNSTMPRFVYQKSNFTPGPGEYDVDSLERVRLQQITNQMSACYKSQVKRCLDYCKADSLKEGKQNKNDMQESNDQQFQKSVIHKREQHFDSSEFFSPPAFLSGVQRFSNQLQENYSSSFMTELKNKNFGKQIQNVQPFNSSNKRNITEKVGQGVGVGSYSVEKDGWNKKSYNIFFH